MSTRRDRAAGAILQAMNAVFDLGFGVDETAQLYRVADFVLAEVDRIPDVSELNEVNPKTDDGAVRSPATPRAVPHPAARAGVTGWRPAPSSPVTDGGAAAPLGTSPQEAAVGTAAPPSVLPRPFLLFRKTDVTGKSGVGVVAWGCEWPDKTASLRWATKHPSTVHWDSVEAILAVHGHDGATVIHWLDNYPHDSRD